MQTNVGERLVRQKYDEKKWNEIQVKGPAVRN